MNNGYKRWKFCQVESVGGVDGPHACEEVAINNSNMENIHLKLCNLFENETL